MPKDTGASFFAGARRDFAGHDVTDYTGLWKLLYDWQTIITGPLAILAAVIGGGMAYWAGRVQAKATRTAADLQVAAINDQLAHLKAEKDEADRRARGLACASQQGSRKEAQAAGSTACSRRTYGHHPRVLGIRYLPGPRDAAAGIAGPEGIALPQVAMHEHQLAVWHGQAGDPLFRPGQQLRGADRLAPASKVHVIQGAGS